jgi:hypothetical protein
LSRHGAGVVARGLEDCPAPVTEILVEFDFHDASSGRSTKRSRAISEA